MWAHFYFFTTVLAHGAHKCDLRLQLYIMYHAPGKNMLQYQYKQPKLVFCMSQGSGSACTVLYPGLALADRHFPYGSSKGVVKLLKYSYDISMRKNAPGDATERRGAQATPASGFSSVSRGASP